LAILGFCDGASHQRKDTYRQSPYDTGVFIMQTTKAAGKWRVVVADEGRVSAAHDGERRASAGSEVPRRTTEKPAAATPSCPFEEELRKCMATCLPSDAAEARHRKRRGTADVAHWNHSYKESS